MARVRTGARGLGWQRQRRNSFERLESRRKTALMQEEFK